jgi:hypothetical protein
VDLVDTLGTEPVRQHLERVEDLHPAAAVQLEPVAIKVTDAGGGVLFGWEAHEAWRLGRGDPSSAAATVTNHRSGTVPPAPKPRWPS